MCGGDGFAESTFDGLSNSCPVCSRSFEESYLICVFLFSICTLGFCFHSFVLFTILFSIFLREITGNSSLLAVISHTEYNISFLFSTVATYARWKYLCIALFVTSELPRLLLAGGRVVQVCFITQSCLTLCDPRDCSPLASSVHGIIPADY